MAETNGMAEITVGGVKYPLLFGRASVQEMSDRCLIDMTGNSVVLLANLVYSGRMNYNKSESQPIVSYKEIWNLVEEFADEPDAQEQEKLLWEIFETSKHGSKWVTELAEIKKKMTAITESLSQ